MNPFSYIGNGRSRTRTRTPRNSLLGNVAGLFFLPLLLCQSLCLLLSLHLQRLPPAQFLLLLLRGTTRSTSTRSQCMPSLLFDEVDQIIIRLFPIMIADKFFETAFHRCRDTFVSRLLSFVTLGAFFDDGLCPSVHPLILLFQVLDEDTREH